ncbi:MAG: 50S ribosomal protein L11 methyltransferase [Armatimonadetes bacterium]|nr:MAG: 50S ribosomal protein L11 methyltransferase [Armatimonadota bacterium]
MKWLRVTAHFPAPQPDLSSAHFLLEQAGSLGTEVGAGDSEISGYLPEGEDTWGKIAEVGDRLFECGAVEVSVRSVEEEDWAEAWKQFFKRRRIGRRLVLCPAWEPYEPEIDDIVITMEPGQAFGTGEHATTQLCLLFLEKTVRPGMRVLDIGTGSGVLAIAAAKLGASVWATECEEAAVAAARANFERNGVHVELLHTETLEGLPDDFDLIVANIVSAVHVRLAPAVRKRIAPGGTWVLSGVIPDNLPLVREAVEGAGFVVEDVVERGGWLAIVCRPTSSGAA